MYKILFSVLLTTVFINTSKSAETDDKRTYVSTLRYIQNGPTREQTDPLYETINLKFSKEIKTVGHALNYIIARSGYQLSRDNLAEKGSRLLMELQLPDVHRRLQPMTLKQAISTLIGEAYQIAINPISRTISFEVRETYKPMLKAAVADFYMRKQIQGNRNGDDESDGSNKNTKMLAKNIITPGGDMDANGRTRKMQKQNIKRELIIRGKTRQSQTINNETNNNPLHNLANQLKSDGVTTAQGIIAIFEENPEAFYSSNSYMLKEGVTLKKPQPVTYQKRSAEIAEIMLLQHYHRFRQAQMQRRATDQSYAGVSSVDPVKPVRQLSSQLSSK